MSHYDDFEIPPARRRAVLIRDGLVGLVLAAVGGAATVYLVNDYREAAPWREARAAEYAREREARDKAEAAGRAPPIATPPPAEGPPLEGPVNWVTPPVWPTLTTYHLPEGAERASVRFQCQVSAEGALSDCTGVETPTGSGLTERLLPALAEARMKPMLMGGRPLQSTVSFSVHFSAQEPAEGQTAEDAREVPAVN